MSIFSKPKDSTIISPDLNISNAFKSFHETKAKLLFVCDESRRLLGVISQGDLNSYLANNSNASISDSIVKVYNTNYKSVRDDVDISEINSILSDYNVIPILGKGRKLIKLAYREDSFQDYSICGLSLGENQPSIVIAELGNNHNGDIKLAREMIELAVKSGADIVKFQMRDLVALYGGDINYINNNNSNLGNEYLYELLSENQLNTDALFELFDQVKKLGKQPLCTPWDSPSLKLLHEYGMRTVKIASADLTNHQLLAAASDLGMTLICSTGMSTKEEVIETSRFLQERGSIFYFLHCQSSYPASISDINLAYMDALREYSRGQIVGYSSHDLGANICIGAVARGARIIEKHFTTNRNLKGVDHRVSLLPSEFSSMVNSIREIEQSIGRKDRRVLSQGELINRATLSKSIFTTSDLKSGHVLEQKDLVLRSPGNGLQPNQLLKLIGCKLLRDIPKETLVYWDYVLTNDVNSYKGSISYENKFDHANWDSLPGCWGIPVRPHDFEDLMVKFQPKMIEFHLSYNDLKKIPSEFLNKKDLPYCVIHAPELYEDEHILDLCSNDINVTRRSLNELQKVIDYSNQILSEINSQKSIGIVTNVGGHSSDSFLPKEDKKHLPNRLMENLNKLELGNAEIWPQTMPPYPWHFGGQRFHNLFVDPNEIICLSKKFNMKLCLDISHTQLACNSLGINLPDILEELLECSAHLHIADADMINGEGLQIDKGCMNFLKIMNIIRKRDHDSNNLKLSWIPEIWQGHENQGSGFRVALNHLCEYL